MLRAADKPLPKAVETFEPPQGAQDAALRGLRWKKSQRRHIPGPFALAKKLARRKSITMKSVKRMYRYFEARQDDQEGTGWRRGQRGYPSTKRIVWDMFGGEVAWNWSRRLVDTAFEG